MSRLIRQSKRALLVFSLFISGVVYSQQYDLAGYLEVVKKNNVDLRINDAGQEAIKEDVKVAKSFLLPTVSANGLYQRDFNQNFLFINDFDGSTIKFRTNFNNTLGATINVSQTLFDPAAFSAIKLARLSEELGKLGKADLSTELTTQASMLYWQALFVKGSVQVLTENSKLAKEQFEQTQKLFEKGVASKLQVQQAETYYQKTVSPIRTTENQYANLLNQLKALANIPADQELILTDKLESVHLGDSPVNDTANLENQPRIKFLKKQLEINKSEIDIRRKYWFPRLALNLAFDYNAQADDFNFKNNQNRLVFGQVAISIPIYSGGRNKAEVNKAVIQQKITELNLEKVQQTFLNELQIARNNLNSALAEIETQRSIIELNEREIQTIKKQLDRKVITPLEYKESRLQLTQSKLDLLNDYLDLHIAQLQINRILGEQNK